MMFRGHSEHSIDAKGRICLPAKFRDALAKNGECQLVVTRGTDPSVPDEFGHCLFLYPLGDFEELQKEIARLKKEGSQTAGADSKLTQQMLNRIERMFIAYADDQEIDKSGRILLSAGLRQWAGIDKDIVCVGQGKRMELWSPERWSRIEALADADADSEEMKAERERVQMAVGF